MNTTPSQGFDPMMAALQDRLDEARARGDGSEVDHIRFLARVLISHLPKMEEIGGGHCFACVRSGADTCAVFLDALYEVSPGGL